MPNNKTVVTLKCAKQAELKNKYFTVLNYNLAQPFIEELPMLISNILIECHVCRNCNS